MNTQWIVTINQWVDHWAADVWRACWQGSAVILLVWGVCRLLPQMTPRMRCWLWRLAYAKLLIALFWSSPVDMPLLRSTHMSAPISIHAPAPIIHTASHLPQPHLDGVGDPTYAAHIQTSLTPLSALMVLWLIGGMVVVERVVREWRSARRHGCVTPLDNRDQAGLAADFQALCRRLGVGYPIALVVTDACERPYIFGVLRPAIVLPAALPAESDRNGLMAVLGHEIAHVRRNDLLWNWLPMVAHALFFFCPFVWLANREWQIAQEVACDEMAVLNTGIDVAAYAEILVRMVTQCQRLPGAGIVTLGMIETPQTLKRRLIAMKFIHPVSRRKLVLAGGAFVVAGVLGIVPWQVVAQGAKPDRILFVSNRLEPHRFSIFAMDSNGSHITRLTQGPVPEFEAISKPDGKTELRPIGAHRNEMELDPVWSPDGKRIAFTLAVPEKPEKQGVVKMNLYVMNADGSGYQQLTYFPYGDKAVSPSWSPDGKQIAFTFQFQDKGAPGGISSSICVTDLKRFWPIAEGMWPSWSPDGKKILYTAFRDNGLATDLYEVNASGVPEDGKKKLQDGVLQGVLSPDRKRLAYISLTSEPNGEKTGNLVVGNSDGSEPKQLTHLHNTLLVGIQWTADSRQIYFTQPTSRDAKRGVNYKIYVTDADGDHLQALTKGDAPDYLGSAPGTFLANNWMDRIAVANR